MIRIFMIMIFFTCNLLAQYIKVGLEEFPPLINNSKSGYTIELLKKIEKTSNFKFKIIIMSYARAKKELELGRIDMIGHTPKTFEQSDFYEYAQDLEWEIPTYSALFVKDKKYFDVENVREQRIGTLLCNVGFFSELLGMNQDKFMEVRTINQLVLMLEKDRLDAIVFERVAIKTSIENLKAKGLDDKILFMIPISFAVSKTSKGNELKKELDDVIKNLNYYGVYRQFLDK